jgi:hypothetical protein
MEDILTKVKPYFSYARELRACAPVISWRCEFFGVKLGLSACSKAEKAAVKSDKNINEAKLFLMGKLDGMEKLKD